MNTTETTTSIAPNKLRIWHIINIPGEAFRFDVRNVDAAIKALDVIAKYDLFLGDGEEKPMTTVGERRQKRATLAGKDVELMKILRAYDIYQLARCPGGVPLVYTNVQGLEVFEDGEWCEFYDDEGNDIEDIRRNGEPS